MSRFEKALRTMVRCALAIVVFTFLCVTVAHFVLATYLLVQFVISDTKDYLITFVALGSEILAVALFAVITSKSVELKMPGLFFAKYEQSEEFGKIFEVAIQQEETRIQRLAQPEIDAVLVIEDPAAEPAAAPKTARTTKRKPRSKRS